MCMQKQTKQTHHKAISSLCNGRTGRSNKELIPTLTKNHTQQIEMLINNTTESMKEMMQLIENDSKTPVISNETKEEKKKETQWET